MTTNETLQRAGLTENHAKVVDNMLAEAQAEIQKLLENISRDADDISNRINTAGTKLSSIDMLSISRDIAKAEQLAAKYEALKAMALNMLIESM